MRQCVIHMYETHFCGAEEAQILLSISGLEKLALTHDTQLAMGCPMTLHELGCYIILLQEICLHSERAVARDIMLIQVLSLTVYVMNIGLINNFLILHHHFHMDKYHQHKTLDHY